MSDNEGFAALVEKVAGARDRAAFTALFNYFAPRIKAYMIRQGADDALAEELVQDVMLTLWRKAALFDPARASIGTWLFRVARNRWIDTLRRDRSAAIDRNDPYFQPDDAPPADTILDARKRDERVRQAMAGLPEEQLTLIRLAFFQGLSHSRIAEETALPLGTVKSRIRLAFLRLKDVLEADERIDTRP